MSDEHPENDQTPIDVIDEGIDICFNDEQPSKMLGSSDLIDSGIVICSIE